MKEYEATIRIEAPAEAVWQILTHVGAYPEWDPYCDRIEGHVALGQKLKAYTKLSPGRAFPVRVSTLKENESMTWTGGMPLGLFKGERTFTLTPSGDNAVEFRLREVFSGPFLSLIGGSLPDMTEPFQKFAEGLKRRAEERQS